MLLFLMNKYKNNYKQLTYFIAWEKLQVEMLLLFTNKY